jgi:hypothetical protein
MTLLVLSYLLYICSRSRPISTANPNVDYAKNANYLYETFEIQILTKHQLHLFSKNHINNENMFRNWVDILFVHKIKL